jgi:ribosomal protein L29
MKIKELETIKIKEVKELKALVLKKKLELLKNQVKMLSGKEKNLKKAWALKKEVSQIMSIIKAKEFLEGNKK